VEWWDPKWIADNVEPKLAGQSGVETAVAQQQAKGPAKAPKAAKPKKRAR
jgi:hypothetical protein